MRAPAPAVFAIIAMLAFGATDASAQASAERLDGEGVREVALAQGQSLNYVVRIERGGSADIVITQQGVDLVVEARQPNGAIVATVDSPNGRQGDEPVEIFAATTSDYTLTVRPFSDAEPAGRFRLAVRALRDPAATRAVLNARAAERASAAGWLRAHGAAFDPRRAGSLVAAQPLSVLLDGSRIIGVGEATHGSREFGDARLALTQALVERHGYRVIGLEASASRLRALRPWLEGGAPATRPPAPNDWIGVRTRAQLFDWARAWNASHPGDRVTIVGLDPQDSEISIRTLARFIEQAYGPRTAAAWAPVEQEFLAADAQTLVFGDSGVSEPARTAAFALLARLRSDAAMLRLRHSDADTGAAIAAATDLAQFADFNGGEGGHSRDWYMAANLATAMAHAGADARAVLWAHNAHVVGGRPGVNATGAHLRASLGCGYRSVALTFGSGAFLAQIPNDRLDRLAVSRLPEPGAATIEGVLAQNGGAGWFATWPCAAAASDAPQWLMEDRPMHWVGGLWDPATPPDLGTRPFALTRDFDAVIYVRRVSAEAAPSGRVPVPPRAATAPQPQ